MITSQEIAERDRLLRIQDMAKSIYISMCGNPTWEHNTPRQHIISEAYDKATAWVDDYRNKDL